MRESDYLLHLYARADALCAKAEIDYRAIESLYAVMLQEYVEDYASLEPPVKYGDSLEYERERMCYILGQCVQLSHASLAVRYTVSQVKNQKDSLAGPEITLLAYKDAEMLAEAFEQTVVSADVVVTTVLSYLKAPFDRFLSPTLSAVLPVAYTESERKAKSVMEEKLSRMRAHLEEEERKARELEAYINRPFAEKVGEEDAVRQQFLSCIRVDSRPNCARVTLPFFFHGSDEPLSLMIAQMEDRTYLSDAGRAFDELCRRLPREEAERMAAYFARVQLEREPGSKGELVSYVRDAQGFFCYLQTLSLIANADLYPTVDEYCFEQYEKYTTRETMPGASACPNAFVEALFSCIRVSYDRDRGIGVHAPYYFNDEAYPMGVGFTVAEDRRVVATDFGDFDGGRLYQRMTWLNEDIHSREALISAICARFDAACAQERVTYSFVNDTADALPRAYFTFLQLASVLGEIGHFIVP